MTPTVNPDLPPPPPPKYKPINYYIIILLVLAYLFNSNAVEWIYPLAHSDYNEFLKYYELRGQVYEIMFFLAFLFAFLNTRKLLKGMAAFVMCLSFASVIDKVFLNITQFVLTDYIIIAFGIIAGVYVYFKQNDTDK